MQFIFRHASLSQDRTQDARTQVARMHGNCDQEITSFHAKMAPLLAYFVEAEALESSDESTRRSDGQIRQQRVP
jgi:hypothetical protein